MKHTSLSALAAACLLLVGCASTGPDPSAITDAPTQGRPVVLTQTQGPIRVVYQISKDEWKDSRGKGLLYLNKLYDQYRAEGVSPDRLHIHAVFHGTAAEHLLTDEAFNRYKNSTGGNPNTALLAELEAKGVEIELCNTRRQSNGWAKDDINPSVTLVNGAFQRVIDLQLMGYAYVRF
jgi:intracellular sulfur oxidation DsrE/DsrF family protein